MSSFLISCGGTGGHLSPGIALAQELVERGHSVRLLISEKRVDARLAEKYPDFSFLRVPGTGLSLHPVRLARFLVSQLRGVRFCRRLIRAERPDAVVGFGGFTSAGMVLAARFDRIPVALHESNRVPGRATRVLGRLAHRVYLPPGIQLRHVPASVTRHVGLPVRREFTRLPPMEARAALGFDPTQRLLVVLGGSQGATVLNSWVRRDLSLLASEGIQVCCVTGLSKGDDAVVELQTKTGVVIRSRFMAFCDRMSELLSAADLAVSRAGSGTLAELARCQTPAVLVPFPQAADDHQRANAAFFERQGGGVVIEQSSLCSLTTEVLDLVFNDALLRTFRANLYRMDQEKSLASMVADLEQIAHGGRSLTPAPEAAEI